MPTRLVFQQDWVVHLSYFHIYHDVPRAIYGQCECSNHFLLQFWKCIAFFHMELFWLNLNFGRLFISGGKVSLPVKFIFKNILTQRPQYSCKMVHLFFSSFLLFFLLLFCQSLDPTHNLLKNITKYKPLFWYWSRFWSLFVFFNKFLGRWEVIILCNCLRINLHKIIHITLKSEVIIKLLHSCIFINYFLSWCLGFLSL